MTTTGGDLDAFLRWGFSDLRSNTTRGVLAEWLVGRLIGADLDGVREEWAAWDVVAGDGTTVEVKSTAYVQAWEPGARPVRPQFRGLLARHWLPEGGYSQVAAVRAQAYVFALHTARQPEVYDALNLDQWEFRVLPGSTVQTIGQASVGLGRLAALGAEPVPAALLADAVTRAGRVGV